MSNNEVVVDDVRTNAEGLQEFLGADLKTVEKGIRRIVRAHDLQSKALTKAAGLTAAQLVLLKGIAELGEVTTTALSAHADISPATVVTILDNLEERDLIERYRSAHDRRIVHTRLTSSGLAKANAAPEPLGSAFIDRFAALPAHERKALVAMFTKAADLLLPVQVTVKKGGVDP
ncbi:MarR family transcriptional regulator [Aliihoeflea aestuarii]|jgi:DNA-binding MarR family transcriptional regulator|nr:MarR family transcriptional regulator [Aliihoeflea aestuarii]